MTKSERKRLAVQLADELRKSDGKPRARAAEVLQRLRDELEDEGYVIRVELLYDQ